MHARKRRAVEVRCHNSGLSFLSSPLKGVPEVTFSGSCCHDPKRILQLGLGDDGHGLSSRLDAAAASC